MIDLNKIQQVHCIGIGGIGMSALARYFKHIGKNVSGYDRTPSDLTFALEREGIDVHYMDRPDLLPPDDEMRATAEAILPSLAEVPDYLHGQGFETTTH